MKAYILYFIFIFMATTQSGYAANKMKWDYASDQQINSCLSSDTFQNISLLYSYKHKNWKLRLIFNPQHEDIKLSNGQPSMFQFYYGVFSKDVIPDSLKRHLKDLVKAQLKGTSGGHWSISSTINGKLSIDYFDGATAIQKTQIEVPKQSNVQKNTLDQEICDLFKEQTFRKLSLNYTYGDETYTVHFVHNPLREALFCSELSKPMRWPLAMTIEDSSYYLKCAEHIKKLIPNELLKDSDSVIDMTTLGPYQRKNPVSLYKTLHPIRLLNKIENPEVDAEIRTLFTSEKLEKKQLHYQLGENFYNFLLIHNPEELSLQSTRGFDTWENGHLTHTTNWNRKIGIFVDKPAPQELLNHIEQLYEISWWDSLWNLSIRNGDKLSITHNKHPMEYIYTPYSWYTWMLNAEP